MSLRTRIVRCALAVMLAAFSVFAPLTGAFAIEAYADDAVPHTAALQTVLYQHATDFPVTDIDIVRPLDTHIFDIR